MTWRVAQFFLKITFLAQHMGTRGPHAYGLHPWLWLLISSSDQRQIKISSSENKTINLLWSVIEFLFLPLFFLEWEFPKSMMLRVCITWGLMHHVRHFGQSQANLVPRVLRFFGQRLLTFRTTIGQRVWWLWVWNWSLFHVLWERLHLVHT